MRRRDEQGFTLIELLVTMAIATVVLLATLDAFDRFAVLNRTQNDTTQAQNDARDTMRDLVATLRQARTPTGQTSPIPPAWTASRSNLVAAAYVASATNPAPGSVAGWVRYCTMTVGTRSSLVVGVRVGDPYVAPGACAPGTANGWTQTVRLNGTLQDPTRLFDFSASSCVGATCLPAAADVQSVGIRLAVGTKPGATAAFNSVIRDAVSFRNRSS